MLGTPNPCPTALIDPVKKPTLVRLSCSLEYLRLLALHFFLFVIASEVQTGLGTESGILWSLATEFPQRFHNLECPIEKGPHFYFRNAFYHHRKGPRM